MSSATRSTVLVAGSANLDFVVRATHVPAPGETVLGRGFSTFPGGKGANHRPQRIGTRVEGRELAVSRRQQS